MEVQASPPRQRKIYLDVLRILACFLVCYNHSQIYSLYLSRPADGSLDMWCRIFLAVPARINVPLYFMISGALLLGKEESVQTVMKKRFVRFLVLLAAASLAVNVLAFPGITDPLEFLYATVSGSINGSYWYLYSYLSFLLLLPFLQKLANRVTLSEIWYMVGLRFLFASVIPGLNYWLSHWGMQTIALNGSFQVVIGMTDILFYPLIGCYLAERLPSETLREKIGWCWALLIVGTVLSALMTYAEGLHSGFTQTYPALFSYSSVIAVFLIARNWLEGRSLPKLPGKLLAVASSTTLGIYLMEPIIGHYLRERHYWPVQWESPTETLQVLYYSVTWCLLCMGIGCLVTCLLRLIPGVKKYL